MAHRHRRAIAAVILALTAAACGHRPRGGVFPDEEPVTVVFHNESLDQADLFAVERSGALLRLGTVQPGRTDTLTIRGGTLTSGGSVDFIARLLGRADTPRSGTVTVHAGEWLAISLPTNANTLIVLPFRDP